MKTLKVAGVAVTMTAALAGCCSTEGPVATTPSTTDEAMTYKDGDYTATGWYGGLPSHIEVALTLRDGIIETVDVTPTATIPESLKYQQSFADAVPEVVIGRPIEGLNVSKIAGASGTPVGFNDALDKIRAQAAD